jgi:hypothetical protein
VTVISGLLLATLLTLVVVPVIYTLLSARGAVEVDAAVTRAAAPAVAGVTEPGSA